MSVAMMKPVRVVAELTPTQQFIRALDRAAEIRDAAHARADADFVERVQEAQARFLPSVAEPSAPPVTS